jgi:hypothetical protein
MVELTITKDFLDRYRQYKLDLLEGTAEEDICYTNLRYLLDNNKTSMSQLYNDVPDPGFMKVNVVTGEIIDKVQPSIDPTPNTMNSQYGGFIEDDDFEW